MRISDWSSDVCSSDLPETAHEQVDRVGRAAGESGDAPFDRHADDEIGEAEAEQQPDEPRHQNGRADHEHRAGGDDEHAHRREHLLRQRTVLAGPANQLLDLLASRTQLGQRRFARRARLERLSYSISTDTWWERVRPHGWILSLVSP